MATVVNQGADSGSGTGMIFGLLALILFIVALFYFIIPLLQGSTGGTQLNVPSQIDVNVQQPQQ